MRLDMKFDVSNGYKRRRMNIILTQLCDYGEHIGLMMGGGWDTKKGTAEFFPYLHPDNCCKRSPSPKRWTPKLKDQIGSWLKQRNIKYSWGR